MSDILPNDDQSGPDSSVESQRLAELAELADAFSERSRRGEDPSVEDYAGRHPHLAAQILELFPALQFMERSLLDRTTESTPLSAAGDRAGMMIGRYKLLERIGEGGFGVVYMAEQQHPVRRKVAVKVIKAGMDSRQVIARFEAERQALAMMDHENIAKVLDAGAMETGADAGRPYFVMELVPGVPITEYCERNRLAHRERLALFAKVCHAVQHAHSKGVIHRDIKPSNVLVMIQDDRPVPKVIDFGVAKAAGQRLVERTLFTQFAQMVGTPLYMSPEQAQMGGLDIDTRSDVYSLGVLLYELLTGSTPFDRKRLGEAALDEVRRIIREEEPPRPSTRLSTAASAAAKGVDKKLELRRLSGIVRGELDWIVMRAMDKDRAQRYETAVGLGRDVERYLADEPVQACPPTSAYRLRKFVRRNKRKVAVGAALLALLVAGTVGTSIGMARARRAERAASASAASEVRQRSEAEVQRDRAVAAERLATERLAQVTKEKDRATEESEVARAISEFLRRDLLAEAAPAKNAHDKKVTVEEVLDRAATRVPAKFATRPRIEAAIQHTIGNTYQALGKYPAAQRHLERALELYRSALGDEQLNTLVCISNLSLLYDFQGRLDLAEPLAVEAFEVGRRVLGEEHTHTLTAMHNLAMLYRQQARYAKAEPLQLKVFEVRCRTLGEEHAETLPAIGSLAQLYQEQGRHAEAEPLFLRTLEVSRRVLGEEHPDTLTSTSEVAEFYQRQGRYAEAEPLRVKVLEASRRVLGTAHPETLRSASNLATLYGSRGEYSKAQRLHAEVLEVRRRVLGDEHPDTLRSINDLAWLRLLQGHYAEAEPTLVKVLEVRRRLFGPEHPDTLRSMADLATLYERQRLRDKAEPLRAELLEIRRRVLGPEHSLTLVAMINVAWTDYAHGRSAKSEATLAEVLQISRRVLGPEHRQTLEAMGNLAQLYRLQEQPAKAERLGVELLELSRQVLGLEHPEMLNAMRGLAAAHQAQRRFAEAERLFVEVLEARRRALGGEHPHMCAAMADLAKLYQAQGQWERAEPLLVKSLELSRRVLEAEHPYTLIAIGNLAELRRSQGRHADAEPLDREALEKSRKRYGDASRETATAMVTLGTSLTKLRKPAEAEPLFREALAIREKAGPDQWPTFSATSLLGGALLDQQSYAEAEPLLLAGYRGLRKREPELPASFRDRVTEALERVVQLYDAWGKPDHAEPWRKELTERKAKAPAPLQPVTGTSPGPRH